jgi:hypothetical protein
MKTFMPVRKVSNWGGNIIGSFPSIKMHNSIKYESTIERDFLYYLEYDSTVIEYYAQPMVINGKDSENKYHTYTPDFQVIKINRKEIVECKPKIFLDQPHTRQQIELRKSWAAANGHHFVIVTDTHLRKDHVLVNLKLLWRYSRLTVPTATVSSCIAYVRSQPVGTTFKDITHFLASTTSDSEMQQPHKQAPFVYSMLFHQILKADLTKPITPITILRLPLSLSQKEK